MAVPTITSVSPDVSSTGVILGTPIVVTFSELMNHSSINQSNFALISPVGTMIITPTEEIAQNPSPISGKKNVLGKFSFKDTTGVTVVTFSPKEVLVPNTTYTVIIIGASAHLVSNPVLAADNTPLATNYTWTFTTGTLNLATPPQTSPLVPTNTALDLRSVAIIPRMFPNPNGSDLTQTIRLVFPDNIDTESFNMEDLLLSVSSILGDPSVTIPTGLTTSATVATDTITITISGWPA